MAKLLIYKKKVNNYDRLTLVMGILGVIFSAIATYLDVAVLITLITAITSTLTTYYTSLKRKETLFIFHATAKQLQFLLQKHELKSITPEQLVNESERLIGGENSAWMNMITK